jgi:hypothetical protein
VLGEPKKGTYTSRSSVVISRSPSWDGEVVPEREGEIAQHVRFVPHTMFIVSPPPLSMIFLPSSSIPYLLGRLSALRSYLHLLFVQVLSDIGSTYPSSPHSETLRIHA